MTLSDDPNDAWAKVELYRWQHGVLPEENQKPLSVPEGLRAMAEAIEKDDPTNFPRPDNVVSVLRYVAWIIEAEQL